MKRKLLASAIALTMLTSAAMAQTEPEYESWVGGFVQHYSPDQHKPNPFPFNYLDDGHTFGAEAGFRFDPKWAVRFELSRIFLDMTGDFRPGNGDDGTMVGADVMYFLDDDLAYLFGGARNQSIMESYRMASYGIGKHWEVSDNIRVITEVARYYDFGQSHNETSAKLGVAYVFGSTSAPAEQPDSDNDGVYDAIDRCPTTPAGIEVDATGCNIDLDGDGVLNNQDQCPLTPANAKVKENGCAVKDSDADGVFDDVDSCPNTPAGTTVNAKGCAANLDIDNDGVLDSVDKCLGTPATDKVDAEGCSILVEKEVSIGLNVLFPNNSSVVSNPDAANIVKFADFMKRYGNTTAVIEGHTSSVGSADYNQFLSEKRAQSVRTLLIEAYGIDSSRLEAVGFGESQLKDTANTAEAHRINRRIEVKVSAMVKETATK